MLSLLRLVTVLDSEGKLVYVDDAADRDRSVRIGHLPSPFGVLGATASVEDEAEHIPCCIAGSPQHNRPMLLAGAENFRDSDCNKNCCQNRT
jgi:hypothetical protein